MTPGPTRRAWWTAAVLIALLAVAASANSIVNGFAYDDIYAIVRDPRAHSLDQWWADFGTSYWLPRWGGDGYRPLTRIAFRLEWAVGAGPAAFHATNVLLHVAGTLLVFWLASALLPLAAAAIASALYAVHPVHTEAIANSVGIAELAVATLVVGAVGLYVRRRRLGPLGWRDWIVIGLCYASACLFKENGIVLPALILLAELLVVDDKAPLRERLVRLRLPLLALTAVAMAYLWARSSVMGELSGFVPAVPFQTLRLTTANRILTMVGASPEWLRLLIWPKRLITDYTPPYIDIAEGPSLLQLPGAMLLLGTLGLGIACWRRSPVTSFGIFWIVITLLPASNFIVPSGILLAERTLLLASVGAMIVLGSIVPRVYERIEGRRGAQLMAAAVVVVLIALGLARSYTRNRDWKSNDTLFARGVVDAPNSYRLHFLMANHLLENGRRQEAERHYREALRLFPYDPVLPFVVAERFRAAGMCRPAIQLYRWAFELSRSLRYGEVGLASCLLQTLELDEAKQVALSAIRNGARFSSARAIIRAADEGRDSLAVRRARADSVARKDRTAP